MQMLRFEIKKLVKSRFLWILLLIFILADIYKIHSIYHSQNVELSGHDTIYQQVKGKITEEKIYFVTSEYKKALEIVNSGNYNKSPNQEDTYTGAIFGDMSEFGEFYDALKYRFFYSELAQEIVEKAAKNIKFYSGIGNQHEVEKNERIIDTFSERNITSYYEENGMLEYIDYDYSNGLIALLIVVGVSLIYLYDNQTKMNVLLYTTRWGIKNLMIIKILTTSIYVLFVTVLFGILDLTVFNYLYELDGFFQPLYSIEKYALTPLNMNILEYIFYSSTIRYLGWYTMALFVLLISILLKESIAVFTHSMIYIGLHIYLCIYTGYLWNPFLLLVNNRLLVRSQFISIINKPILKHEILILACLVFDVLFIVFILFLSKRKDIISREKIISRMGY